VLAIMVRSIAVRLLLMPVLGVAACAQRPPIRLNPPVAQHSQPRRMVRPVQPAPAGRQAEAAPPAISERSCASPSLGGLTAPRKDELFRQFAAAEGQAPPVAAPPRPAACQAAGP